MSEKKDPVLDILAPPMAGPQDTTLSFGNAVLSRNLPLVNDDSSRHRRYKGDMEYGDWHV